MTRGILRVVDLYRRSTRSPGSSCWLWDKPIPPGAGKFGIWTFDHDRNDKRTMPAAAAVWNIAHGRGTGGQVAYRTCCDTRCVNPAHVRLGTRADVGQRIIATGVLRGRSSKAKLHLPKAWAAYGLTPTPAPIVVAIRSAPASRSSASLGRELGLCTSTVCRIRRGESRTEVAA